MCVLSRDKKFTKRLDSIYVDEGHSIWAAGIEKYGQPAFRPAYGKLDEWRVIIGTEIPFQVLSATLPPNILTIVKEKTLINSNHVFIKISTNRPNITYATRSVNGRGINDLCNIDFVVPDRLDDASQLHKAIIFFDSKDQILAAFYHLESRFPSKLQGRGIIKIYHGEMSRDFLQDAYASFENPEGVAKILLSSSVASMVSSFSRCSSLIL